MSKISSRQQQKKKTRKNQSKTESGNQSWNYKKSNHFYAARENAEMAYPNFPIFGNAALLLDEVNV